MEILLKEEIGGKTLSIQTGKVAKQASGSVVVQYGDTVVLVTVVSTHEARPGDFLPLTVEYQEKIYAAGRIPGNYFRREIGRPSEKETLTARLIDRPMRPLFPKGYRYETQVIATVLSKSRTRTRWPWSVPPPRCTFRTSLSPGQSPPCASPESTANSESTPPSRNWTSATSTSSWPGPRPVS